MKRAEIVLVVGLLIGTIGNLFQIPYSNEIFMIACFLLSCLYFYLGFAHFNEIPFRKIFKKSSYKEISTGCIAGSIGLGISFSIIIIGFLFKFLILPGSHEMLIIGTVFLAAQTFFGALIFFKKHKGRSEFYIKNFKRVFTILILGLISYWFPLDSLIDVRYRGRPKYAELLKKSVKNPDNEQVKVELELEREKNRED